jgi:hypothetical protein
MSTTDIHPEEEFITRIRAALEYGAENRNDISQEVFNAALAIPTNLAYFIKQHKQHTDVLHSHNVQPEFRAIPAYFEKLDKLFTEGHTLRENSYTAPAKDKKA